MAPLLITIIIISIAFIVRYGFMNSHNPFGVLGIVPLFFSLMWGFIGDWDIERVPVTYVAETTSWKVIVRTSATPRLFESERMEDFNNWTSDRPGYLVKPVNPFGIIKPEHFWKFEVEESIEQEQP